MTPRPAPMQNVRAVSLRADLLLAPPRRVGGKCTAAPAAARTLGALRFLGVKLVALATSTTPTTATSATAAATASTASAATTSTKSTASTPPATTAPPTLFAALQDAGLSPFFDAILETPAAPPPAAADALHLAPADVLHAGTALDADVNAALAAGMRAAWLAPNAHFHPTGAAVLLRRLDELPDVLRFAETARLRRTPTSRATRDLVSMLRGFGGEPAPGYGHRHDDPEHFAGPLILEVAAKLRSEAAPLEVLRGGWAGLVGKPLLAAASTPEKISPTGTLRVHCENTVVREELSRWHGKRLLEAVRQQPGCTKVSKISFHI